MNLMNEYYFYGFIPRIPSMNEKPPTVYALLESIVNYNADEKTKIAELASKGRTVFFDFDYPLSEKVNKEEFETIIINHFLMRRIGFDTFTAFKIQLNVKLNEIMPIYNKLFDLLNDNDLFGEITKKDGTDNRQINSDNTSNTHNSSSLHNTSSTETSNTYDKRYSDTPQNQLENVRNGQYVTDYTYDTNNSNSSDTANSNGINDTNTTGTNNTKDDNIYHETISHINMIDLYMKMNSEIKNIYTMIFKDLDCLFYQLV